ncbi:putative RNA-binding family protein [Quillaja saponaria]|uniref:RNA-binding family protein n=1 Tax=Quillaja saponaria TaxID=32244 RepID=A0AAD7QCD3_QUISA|nr:putative RNA-binding family protein [Quillaja saponaria]
MTIDDESSIYIGGLSYDSTEDSIRRVFDFYGAIVAVKIINDHGSRGKCYGFVTYTNPRSAVDAINDMNGRAIDGRIIKVSDVRTRGGRSNFNREHVHHNVERNGDWDRGRDHERGYDRDRNWNRNRSSDLSRERDRSRDLGRVRDRRYDPIREPDQARGALLNKDQDQDRTQEYNEQEHSGDHARDRERDRNFGLDRDRDMDKTSGHDTIAELERDELSRRRNCFTNTVQPGLELSPDSNHNYSDQAKDQLERSTQRLEQLRNEVSQFEAKLEEKQFIVSDLQKKSMKLEDALISAKKHSSYRQMQLTKLHKCFRQVKDSTERLKSCEQELQALVDMAMLESDDGVDLNVGDLTIGNA